MVDRREHILDELLVLRCREGSHEAFRLLVTRWQARLWRHAFRLTGRDDAAWDVIQESWIAVTKGIRRLNDDMKFRPWIYAIVTRKAADWQRRRRKEEGPRDSSACSVAEAPDHTESDGAIGVVRAALRTLPRDRQGILALRYLEGFDVLEIAEVLGVPEGTAKSRLHHARQQLRGIIERITK